MKKTVNMKNKDGLLFKRNIKFCNFWEKADIVKFIGVTIWKPINFML